MIPILMQDWVTIRGIAGGTPVAQDPRNYLRTRWFQDITFILDVRELQNVNGPTFVFETAPIRDETLFQAGIIKSLNEAAGDYGVGLTNVHSVLAALPAVPVAHWTRWRLLAPAAAWDITFRIWASGNTIC